MSHTDLVLWDVAWWDRVHALVEFQRSGFMKRKI